MKRVVLRLVALMAVLGQLQQVPVAIACAAQHKEPSASHCSDTVGRDGPTVSAAHDAAQTGPCAVVGLCATQAPAIAGLSPVMSADGTMRALVDASLPPLSSISPAPPSPPPQA